MSRDTNKGKPILGIDINANEIRVVEIQGSWPSPEILRADYIATPPGAVVNGEIVHTADVAKSLSTLLVTMGAVTRSAVIGISPTHVATRVLDIPQVPPTEIHSVLQGEIVHQRILPDPNGEFDYLSLETADLRVPARPRLLVMAAESRILATYISVAEQSGIKLLALEPGLIAMYRAAAPISKASSPSLYLMIGSTVSEVAIVENGPIRLYRRIDIGSTQVLPDLAVLTAAGAAPDAAPLDVEAAEPGIRLDLAGDAVPEETPSGVYEMEPSDSSPAKGLLTELQRSMDYYHREYPEAPTVTNIVVACCAKEIKPFVSWLSSGIHVPATTASVASYATIADSTLKSTFDGVDSSRYLRAVGLAMRGLDQVPTQVPKFDLLRHDKDESKKPGARTHLTIALAASILLMLGACLNVFRLTKGVTEANNNLYHATQEAKRLHTYRGMPIDEVRTQESILDIVRTPGVPLPELIDAVAISLPAAAAVSDMSTDATGGLNISGDAAADTDIIQFLDSLRQQPQFARVSLDRLDRTSVTPASSVVRYQISLKLH